MDNAVVIRIKPTDNEPQVIFVGSKKEAEAKLFRAIVNSEGEIKKVANDYGLAFEVVESHPTVSDNKRTKVEHMTVKYLFQTVNYSGE